MNNWKDEIIHSLDGLEAAKAPENGFDKLQQRLQHRKLHAAPRTWISIAAAVALIVMGNAYVLIGNHAESDPKARSSTTSITTNYNIYHQ